MVETLSLRIYGGPESTGLDKTPLVSLGAIPLTFQPIPPVLVDEPTSWMIVHAQDYTLYAMHSRQFRTAAGDPGQAMICLFFPPQLRLGEGKSPLALLTSLLDSFLVIGAPDGCLPDHPLDNSPYRMLLGRYPLEPRPVMLPIMQGQEPASFCVANQPQLDALMRHSRYDALARVGRLELGFHCESTIDIVTSGPRAVRKIEPKPAPAAEAPKKEKAPAEETPAPAPVKQQEEEKPTQQKKVKRGPILILTAVAACILLFLLLNTRADDSALRQLESEVNAIGTEVAYASEVASSMDRYESLQSRINKADWNKDNARKQRCEDNLLRNTADLLYNQYLEALENGPLSEGILSSLISACRKMKQEEANINEDSYYGTTYDYDGMVTTLFSITDIVNLSDSASRYCSTFVASYDVDWEFPVHGEIENMMNRWKSFKNNTKLSSVLVYPAVKKALNSVPEGFYNLQVDYLNKQLADKKDWYRDEDLFDSYSAYYSTLYKPLSAQIDALKNIYEIPAAQFSSKKKELQNKLNLNRDLASSYFK